MALQKHTRSVRPQSGALILGVGRGSGSTLTGLYKMGTAGAQMIDIRARSDAASGYDARVLYARLHHYGTVDAIRRYCEPDEQSHHDYERQAAE